MRCLNLNAHPEAAAILNMTLEDVHIWVRVLPPATCTRIWRLYLTAGRRDAELMRWACELRGERPLRIWQFDVGGARC